ncbi:hypothetical protein ABZ353_10610 [Streptomyces niveus]|uniref:hypothetical protein n=1 Tax=Streptomyces niveus TaxID=193462 RepID=UPI0033FD028D
MVTRKDIGRRVAFPADFPPDSDVQGVLREVMKDWEDPAASPANRVKKPIAFIGPLEGGGREWMVPLNQVKLS